MCNMDALSGSRNIGKLLSCYFLEGTVTYNAIAYGNEPLVSVLTHQVSWALGRVGKA